MGPHPGAAQSPGPEAFLGVWQGELDVGAARLRLVFHVTEAEDGAFSGTLDSPDQGAAGMPASDVRVEDGQLHFIIERLALKYVATLSSDRNTLSGTFTQGAGALPLELTRAVDGTVTGPDRPQNPEPPFPYRVQEVHVQSAPGVTLAGTLTLPEGEGPFPAAVLVSGSGPQDRDEALLGHRPFLVLSDHLTRAGIAVLRYDDRGVAASTGTFTSATSEDFTTDALSAVGFLKSRPDIGPVGIVGHSEGGLVGPLAAVRSDQVDYVVLLAGPGITGEEIVLLQGALIARAEGTPDDEIERMRTVQTAVFRTVRTEADSAVAAERIRRLLENAFGALPAEERARLGPTVTPEGVEAQVRQVTSPWFRYFLTYDPRVTLERVRVPVLALNGERDLQVPAEVNLREIGAALERGGNPDATTRLLPGLNHLFQLAETGAPSEYARISETMNPAAMEAVSTWILQRFPTPR